MKLPRPTTLTRARASEVIAKTPMGGSMRRWLTNDEIDWAVDQFMDPDSPYDCFNAVIRAVAKGEA